MSVMHLQQPRWMLEAILICISNVLLLETINDLNFFQLNVSSNLITRHLQKFLFTDGRPVMKLVAQLFTAVDFFYYYASVAHLNMCSWQLNGWWSLGVALLPCALKHSFCLKQGHDNKNLIQKPWL